MNDQLWHRERWSEAVWSSDLRPLERLVALAYADHAHDRQVAWVTYPRLMQRTGLSRDAVARAIRGLVEGGWLVVETPARQHRAPVYRLSTPVQQSAPQTAEPVDNDTSGPGDGPLIESSSPPPVTSSPSPVTSSPPDGLNPTSDRTTNPTADGAGEALGADDKLTQGVRALGCVPDDLLADVVARLRADESTTTTPEARLRSAGSGWVTPHLAAARRAHTSRLDAQIAVIRSSGVECNHGVQGGAEAHPGTGRALCPLCRRQEAS